jgi:hypothetical protein
MVPKKKPGAAAHPSTSKAPSHAATDPMGATVAPGDADAAGNVTGAGGAITIPPPSLLRWEQEALEEDNISSTLVARFHKMWEGRISNLRLATSLENAAAAMAPAPERIATS